MKFSIEFSRNFFFKRQQKGDLGDELRHGHHPPQGPQNIIKIRWASKILEPKRNNVTCLHQDNQKAKHGYKTKKATNKSYYTRKASPGKLLPSFYYSSCERPKSMIELECEKWRDE